MTGQGESRLGTAWRVPARPGMTWLVAAGLGAARHATAWLGMSRRGRARQGFQGGRQSPGFEAPAPALGGARLIWARFGMAVPGSARPGEAGNDRGNGMHWGSCPRPARSARLDLAGQGLALARQARARRGTDLSRDWQPSGFEALARTQGLAWRGAALQGEAGSGPALAWQGMDFSGRMVEAGSDSPPPAQGGSGLDRPWRVPARPGMTRRGAEVTAGKDGRT